MNNIFKNKVVTFDTINQVTALFNPKIKKLNGKKFVAGIIPEGATVNDWAKDIHCYISWEHIVDFIIFDNIEDYISSTAKSQGE